MHKVHIAIAGALLVSAGCMLPAEDIEAGAAATEGAMEGVTTDEVYSAGSEVSLLGVPADDAVREPEWTCVSRYRRCVDDDHGHHGRDLHAVDARRDGDDHGGGFERCRTDYYYVVDRDKHDARHEALDQCEDDHPDDWWRCNIVRCYR